MDSSGFEIPLYRTFDPDDLLDFHAARLLVLLEICGAGDRSRRIDGRTKLAKLDFFLRYPRFLREAHSTLGIDEASSVPETELEAPMIRYRYGPWDPKYRDYLAFLEARGLLRVVGSDVDGYSLTALGRRTASDLIENAAFAPLVLRARSMIGNLAGWNGTQLKNFIYERFAREVGDLQFHEVIDP